MTVVLVDAIARPIAGTKSNYPTIDQMGKLVGYGRLGGPANLTLPAVTGTPTVGQTLTSTDGTWSGSPTFAYLWFVDGSPSATTTNTYTVTAGDVSAGSNIYCRVTATDETGVTQASSNTVTTAIIPANTVAPVISGTAIVGQTLSSTTGTWTGTSPTYSYQWKADTVAISGATSSTFVVAGQNVSYTCTVTATNNAGSVAATSNALLSQTSPVNTVAPAVTGDTEVGSVLTSGTGTWTGTATITYGYQWQRDGANIGSATSSTYTTQTADIGKTIRCVVTGTNSAGNSSANSNGTVVTVVSLTNTVAPAISGDLQYGSVLTSTTGTWTGSATITYAYQWRADGTDITGETASTYTTVLGDIGKSITCRVTATNPAGSVGANSNALVPEDASFDPSSLFASSENGAWYDPSDFDTMFQDSAGTIPVTAVSQSVGLVLDKSKGIALGSEIVTSGSFDSGTGWTLGSGWSITGGKLVASSAPASAAKFACPSVAGWYRLSITIDSITQSDVTFRLETSGGGNATNFTTYFTSSGTKTFYVYADGNQAYAVVSAGGGSGFSGEIDNVSVKSIAGNHAIQSTSAARPVLENNGNTKPYRNFDAVDDTMGTTFASSLGSSCTVGRANATTGAEILTSQTIGTSYTASADDCTLIIVDRALTGQETTDLTAWLNGKAGF